MIVIIVIVIVIVDHPLRHRLCHQPSSSSSSSSSSWSSWWSSSSSNNHLVISSNHNHITIIVVIIITTMYHNVSQYITFRLQTAMRFLRRTIANKVQSIDWQYVNRLLTSENLSNLSSFFHFQIFSNLSAFPTDFIVRAANQYGIMQPMMRKASFPWPPPTTRNDGDGWVKHKGGWLQDVNLRILTADLFYKLFDEYDTPNIYIYMYI